MKKISSLIIIVLIFITCNKTENMKHKLLPDRKYEKESIDNFYWVEGGWDYTILPLFKPFRLIRHQGTKKWGMNTSEIKNQLSDISPIQYFNVLQIYIYGYKSSEKDEEDSNFDSLEKWFIINTQEKKLTFFDKESVFKAELKKLNLPETFLTPDEVYEQYKNDPVLPWFPEEVKKQLEEVKKQKK